MPKVSVIVPVYGVEKYIRQCAVNLFEQTLDDIEYIFVNDCTRDNSMEILRQTINLYPERGKQVKIIEMPVNSGRAAVRKAGILAAEGDFIIHCDSDDWVDVTMYEKMWKKAVEGKHDIVLCGFHRSDRKGNDKIETINLTDEHSLTEDMLACRVECFVWNKLVEKRLYRNITTFPVNNMFEDVALSIPLSFHSRSTGLVDEPLYYYFTNPEGICKVDMTEEKFLQMKSNATIAMNHIRENGGEGKYKKELFHYKCNLRVYATPLSHAFYMAQFPETNLTFLADSLMPLDKKLGHLTKMLGIHGISKIFKK